MNDRMTRVRIAPDGGLEVVDPGWEHVGLLRALDPSFQVRRRELPGFSSPRILATRRRAAGISRTRMASMDDEALWQLHERLRAGQANDAALDDPEDQAGVLDIKRDLARRWASPCRLCARECGAERGAGQVGPCGVGAESRLAECFVHVAEEDFINPSAVLGMRGCALQCRYCQQWSLARGAQRGEPLSGVLWSKISALDARSISFAGGNPDESLPGILDFLAAAPGALRLPVVWNSHGYVRPRSVHLLDGVVDAWLPDLKYGNPDCARALSGIEDYPDVAMAAIEAMVRQSVPVIVRMLVLPGHVDCCHGPSLEMLARLRAPNLYLSIRDQYHPDGVIGPQDGALGRRPTAREVGRVRQAASKLGLQVLAT